MNPHLRDLQAAMLMHGLDGYIVSSADPHLSEYPPSHWKVREWLSGFTGSAGTLAITISRAALWVDSRYYIQVQNELKGTSIEVCRLGAKGVPSIEGWFAENLSSSCTVAFDGRTFSFNEGAKLVGSLEAKGFLVKPGIDLVSPIWVDRPQCPARAVYIHPPEFCGESVAERLKRIRERMVVAGVDTLILSLLDEVAWTFCFRGSDIDYNPVALSYALVTSSSALLFIDCARVPPDLQQVLRSSGVDICAYDSAEQHLITLPAGSRVAFDGDRINHSIATSIPLSIKRVECISIPYAMKACKGAAELAGIGRAMVADGVALCHFFHWLEGAVAVKQVSELDIVAKLQFYRRQQQGYVCESFAPIAAYADHGATVHYSPSHSSSYTVENRGFLLIDSGGQYIMGTTDTTRTIHLGVPTGQERIDYTLVLKGLIGLSMARFPSGTRGTQLDALARSALWSHGLNYGHGTGHGVGAFLNVHEGPQSIRPNENKATLELGMVQSIEPGLYREGLYGIRIENLVACEPYMQTEFGEFYQFSTLTLCPIDTKPINAKMLTEQERVWLNNYHQRVNDVLAPLLSGEVREWLSQRTRAI